MKLWHMFEMKRKCPLKKTLMCYCAPYVNNQAPVQNMLCFLAHTSIVSGKAFVFCHYR